MNIVIVLEYFYDSSRPIGGAERQLAKLVGELMARDVKVELVTGRWVWGEPRRTTIKDIPVRRLFTCWGMFNLRGLRRFANYVFLLSLFCYLFRHRKEYDLIHCHSAKPSVFVAALAGKLFRKATLARPMASGAKWGDISRMKSSLLGSRWMLKRFRDIDRIIALNGDVAVELESIGVKPAQIVLMPNGVETDSIVPRTSYEAASEFVVTFVGRLHPQKGVDVLLSALQRVAVVLPRLNWRLRLIGSGPLRDELEARARELGIDGHVEFVGQVPDVIPLLRGSDVFVLPSLAEGMSNALLEAMSCGLPCVASRIQANAEIIRDGENGLLVDVRDDKTLADDLVRLSREPGLREKLGQAARQTVNTHYSIKSVAERYIALYQDLLVTTRPATTTT